MLGKGCGVGKGFGIEKCGIFALSLFFGKDGKSSCRFLGKKEPSFLGTFLGHFVKLSAKLFPHGSFAVGIPHIGKKRAEGFHCRKISLAGFSRSGFDIAPL